MVGGDNGHSVDAVGAGGLSPRHLAEVGVAAVRGNAEVLRRGLSPRGVRGQGTRHQLPAVVDAAGNAVHRANEAPRPPPTIPNLRRRFAMLILVAFSG
jgi:hypothetical protein